MIQKLKIKPKKIQKKFKKKEKNLDEKIEEEEKKDKTNSEKLFINNLDKNEKNRKKFNLILKT